MDMGHGAHGDGGTGTGGMGGTQGTGTHGHTCTETPGVSCPHTCTGTYMRTHLDTRVHTHTDTRSHTCAHTRVHTHAARALLPHPRGPRGSCRPAGRGRGAAGRVRGEAPRDTAVPCPRGCALPVTPRSSSCRLCFIVVWLHTQGNGSTSPAGSCPHSRAWCRRCGASFLSVLAAGSGPQRSDVL